MAYNMMAELTTKVALGLAGFFGIIILIIIIAIVAIIKHKKK